MLFARTCELDVEENWKSLNQPTLPEMKMKFVHEATVNILKRLGASASVRLENNSGCE